VGVDAIRHRTLWLWQIGDVRELDVARLPAAPFVCLLAWHVRGRAADEIGLVARRLLDAGCAYVCVTGDDCERVHDIFEEEVVGAGDLPAAPLPMSTRHADESTEQVLWSWLCCTEIPYEWGKQAVDSLAIVIDGAFDGELLRRACKDPLGFEARYLF